MSTEATPAAKAEIQIPADDVEETPQARRERLGAEVDRLQDRGRELRDEIEQIDEALEEAEEAIIAGETPGVDPEGLRSRRQTLQAARDRLDVRRQAQLGAYEEAVAECQREAALDAMQDLAGRAAELREQEHGAMQDLAAAIERHTERVAELREQRSQLKTDFRNQARQHADTPKAICAQLVTRGADLAGVLPQFMSTGEDLPTSEAPPVQLDAHGRDVRELCGQAYARRQ